MTFPRSEANNDLWRIHLTHLREDRPPAGMVRTPGRPISPTAGSRTRPEAQEIARRQKAENDWFRHDGKNVEPPPAGHVRLNGPYSGDIAQKMKGEPEAWFQHNMKNPAAEKHPGRTPTAESKKCKEKVYGSEEKWFKFDDNQDYHTPRPENRMTSVQGKEIYNKLAKKDTNTWYHHDHGKGDGYVAPVPKSRSGPEHRSEANQQRMRPSGTPTWYKTDRVPGDDLEIQGSRPASRLKTADAESYQERNKTGTADNWFGHKPSADAPHSPRVHSPEAESNAGKQKGAAGNWFNHDANRNYADPKPNARGSSAAKDMKEKSRGNEMSKMLTGNQSTGEPQSRPAERIKPEAQDIARKSIQGLMSKFLNQEENKGYNSARPCGRAVKSEAAETAQKNRGVMGDCMQGHPGMAVKKKPGRSVKPEAAEIAQKSKGQVDNLLGNYGKHPASGRAAGRSVKPEASENALRNKGQMDKLMGSYGKLQLSGRPVARLNTQAAQENAMKGKGSMGSVMQMQA